MAPAPMAYWLDGGAGNFFFAYFRWRAGVSPGGELWGRSRPAPASTPGVDPYVGLSLPNLRLRSSRSLSLAEGAGESDRRSGWHPRRWLTGSTAAPAISFLLISDGAPVSRLVASYGVDRGRHRHRHRELIPTSDSLSRICGCGARGLYPLLRGPANPTGARDGTRADGLLARRRRRQWYGQDGGGTDGSW